MDKLHLDIAIVDDLQAEIDSFHSILADYAAANQMQLTLHCFHCAEELLKDYRPFAYTAIFIDIYMDRMTGIEAAEKIRAIDSDTLIIFLTVSKGHMSDGFRFHSYDYINKPADRKRLFSVMDDILKRYTVISGSPKLTFSSHRKEHSILYSDIMFVRSQANYLEITDSFGNTYKTRMTFSSIKDKLDEVNHFLQLLRGLLVNMDYITDFDNETCRLKGNISLPINVRNAKKIEQVWHNYMFNKIRREQREHSNIGPFLT